MSKRLIAVLAGAAMLAMGSGCGGEDEESLTKAEFIERGDAICTEANKRSTREFSEQADKNSGGSQGAATFEEEGIEAGEKIFVPRAEEQAEALAELPAPEGEEEEIEAILDAMEAGVAKAKADPSSFYDRPYPFEKASELQSEYGFKVCGGGAQA